jgi:hypothetical protein
MVLPKNGYKKTIIKSHYKIIIIQEFCYNQNGWNCYNYF